jgi:hypothetical protein
MNNQTLKLHIFRSISNVLLILLLVFLLSISFGVLSILIFEYGFSLQVTVGALITLVLLIITARLFGKLK